jgi:hypothetical protein
MATADLHAVIHLVDSPEPGASRSRHVLRYPLNQHMVPMEQMMQMQR